MRRTLLAILASLVLLVATAVPAQADTWLCNASSGFYCGKVWNSSASTRSIIVWDHDGRSRYVYPGQNSRSVGIRDVSRFWIPRDSSVAFSGIWRWHDGPRSFHPDDNGEWWGVRVY